jgi:Protein of unknown function (DUF3037)
MSKKFPYTYTILRYVHDVMTGEFINVGVVMHVPSQRQLLARTRTTIGRIRGVFPDLDRNAFSVAMHAVQRAFRKIAKENAEVSLFDSEGDASEFARKAVPADDSSLQWSAVGSGLTSDAKQTFERLYERFVARYDTHSRHRRTDDDVWRPVLQKLEERNLASLATCIAEARRKKSCIPSAGKKHQRACGRRLLQARVEERKLAGL